MSTVGPKIKIGIRRKIILLTLLILLLTVTLNTLISNHMFRQQYTSALQSEMNVICLNLKSQLLRILTLGIPVGDIEGFETQCHELVARHDNVSYAMIVQTNGKILFHDNPQYMGTTVRSSALRQVLEDRAEGIYLSQDQDGVYYNMVIPIEDEYGQGLGSAAVVGIATALVDNKARQLMEYGILLGLVSIIIATVVLLTGLSQAVTRPLSKLLDTIKDIRTSSNLSKRVEITSHDELGVLAEAFNHMTEDLQKTTTSIENLNREIEQRKQAEARQVELREQIEATNAELKSFAYIVSHDLKAPLRGIKTIADWIQADYADKLDEDGREQLAMLGQRVDRMKNLIEGVLQYSRLGREQEDIKPVHLNNELPEIIDSLGVPEHITVSIDTPLPKVYYEPTRIAQVFQNLLSNALKYMDKPKGEIHIDFTEDSDSWIFRVSDNGPGIEEQYYDKIFGIFQTLNRRDEYESTGFGLAVDKKTVEAAGGRIWVTSEVGKGSTFSFTVPKHIISPSQQETAATSASDL